MSVRKEAERLQQRFAQYPQGQEVTYEQLLEVLALIRQIAEKVEMPE